MNIKSTSFINFITFMFNDDEQGWTLWDTLGLLIIAVLLSFGCGIIPFLKLRSQKTEGKEYIVQMNSSQLEYFSQQGKFANSLNQLNLKINRQRKRIENYNLSTKAIAKTAFSYAIPRDADENSLNPDNQHIYSYVGAVFLMPNSTVSESTTIAIICKNSTPGNIKPKDPSFEKGMINCGAGTTEVGKYI